MLVRLLGKENEALAGEWDIPFTDVAAWAKPYVGYAYANGLTNGTSDTTFGGKATISASQYITFVLRALGYESGTDFEWNAAWELSDEIGLTGGSYGKDSKFLRGDVAVISEAALSTLCKDSEETLLDAIRDFIRPAVGFEELMEAVNARRKELYESEFKYDEFEKYMVNDTSVDDLLSDAEIAEIMKTGEAQPAYVSYDEAVYDIDVMFRAFKSAYGAYYYFGDETFNEAKAEIIDWLEGRKQVHTGELSEVIGRAFDFCTDAHAFAGSKPYEQEIRFEYFYCEGQDYAKDDEGYYKYLDGEKWYFDFFSDSRVRMEYRLSDSGEIVYSPVLFCKLADMRSSEVVLKNSDGETQTQTLKWVLSEDYDSVYRVPDFKLLEENGVSYISIRNFDQSHEEGELPLYEASGTAVKDAELVIVDIRGNGGGADLYARNWVRNFTGDFSEIPGAFSNRFSTLRLSMMEPYMDEVWDDTHGTVEYGYLKGHIIKNDIPVIVLVDDMCGSAGESTLNFMRAMDNVVVVGSNSAGYQMCGNVAVFRMPNSNLHFSFGVSLSFEFEPECVDYKGYEPDVWCNPKTALESVLNMLIRYEQADVDDVFGLYDQLDGTVINKTTIEIVDMYEVIIGDGGRLGSRADCRDEFKVLVNGAAPSGDFTVTSSDESICTVQKNGKDSFLIIGAGAPAGSPEATITVSYGKAESVFYWQSNG